MGLVLNSVDTTKERDIKRGSGGRLFKGGQNLKPTFFFAMVYFGVWVWSKCEKR